MSHLPVENATLQGQIHMLANLKASWEHLCPFYHCHCISHSCWGCSTKAEKEKRIYTEHKDTSQKLSQTSIILHIHLQDLQPLANLLEKLWKCLGCWYLAGTYERYSAQSVNIALLLKTARAARKVIRALSTWRTQLTSSSGDQLQVLGGLFPH